MRCGNYAGRCCRKGEDASWASAGGGRCAHFVLLRMKDAAFSFVLRRNYCCQINKIGGYALCIYSKKSAACCTGEEELPKGNFRQKKSSGRTKRKAGEERTTDGTRYIPDDGKLTMCVSRRPPLSLRPTFACTRSSDRAAQFVGIGKQHSLDPAILDGAQLFCPFYTPP